MSSMFFYRESGAKFQFIDLTGDNYPNEYCILAARIAAEHFQTNLSMTYHREHPNG